MKISKHNEIKHFIPISLSKNWTKISIENVSNHLHAIEWHIRMPAQHQKTAMYNIAGMLKMMIRHISVGPSNRQNEIDKWPIAGYQVATNFF